MEFICKNCSKKFETKESLEQHSWAKHRATEPKKPNFKKYFIFISLIVIIILFVLSINNYIKKPGEYDNLAKCLTEKGAIIYGNDFCQYTAKQLNYFGKSKKYLNYIKCIENEKLCDEKDVKATPTWEIDGKMYEQVQTLEKLAKLTGC